MRIINKIKNNGILFLAGMALLVSCNKLYTDPVPLPVADDPAGNTLAATLAASANDSLYYRLVLRSGILTDSLATITDPKRRFTMFVPDNNAMKVFVNAASGGAVPLYAPDAVFSGFIAGNIPVATAAAIVYYNTVPQLLTTASFPTSFPNLQYATIFNPAPSISAFLRLTVFPSKRGSIAWVNNVPLSAADEVAANGIIHHTPAVVLPPGASLWARISTDSDMTYFKAAVLRADSGTAVPPATAGTFEGALDNIGANLTVFVPKDSAMRAAITALIAQGLIAQGIPPASAASSAAVLASSPDVFSNPALYGAITPSLVKIIVAYHILGTRAFTVNFPASTGNFYTLIGGPPYPGLSIQATFAGPQVAAATVKGAGNATASNFLINPRPSIGTSDQNATNGVLHKIDQVLRPQ